MGGLQNDIFREVTLFYMGQDQSTQLKCKGGSTGMDGAERGFIQSKVNRRKHRYFVSSGNLEGVENIETILQKNDLSPFSEDGKNFANRCEK